MYGGTASYYDSISGYVAIYDEAYSVVEAELQEACVPTDIAYQGDANVAQRYSITGNLKRSSGEHSSGLSGHKHDYG